MKLEDYKIETGLNEHQKASIERTEKTIDYESSKKLSYADILSITKGLDVVSEFFDVNACVMVSGTNVEGVALGKSLEEALTQLVDINPIAFLNANIITSTEINSDIAKMIRESNIIIAPKFTKNAIEYLDAHDICYVTINTPLKEYKNFLSNEIVETPLGLLTQTPNVSELNKDSFKVVTKVKPTVEQIEDAVFAWKIAKHTKSSGVVVAKDLKTSAISQGLSISSVESALDMSCELSKESILASDLPVGVHEVNAAIQCRISLIIVPSATSDIIEVADKYNLSIITTGVFNLSYC